MVEPWLDDGDVRLYHGDALEQLALMPSESVQCAITSPPFYSLRDYNAEGQIGLEATLGEWLAALVAVFSELKRVLRRNGTFFLEIGDTYIDKQLAGAPWRLAFALQEAGWFLRSDIVWARLQPNPMPESVTDRPTKSHSYVFLLTKAARYFYDADAIREDGMGRTDVGPGSSGRIGASGFQRREIENPAGRNARSVWSIATEPTPFAHFATFPQALVERCIKAGTSEHGACSECGAPWRRITERSIEHTQKVHNGRHAEAAAGFSRSTNFDRDGLVPGRMNVTTTGWEPICACYDPPGPLWGGMTDRGCRKPCVVLDPFMGSGTTALVARRLGRHAVGIELNAEYLAIAASRLQQPTLWSEPV